MDKGIQTMAGHWLNLLFLSLLMVNTQVFAHSGFVNITILHSAKKKGAVCLDGSPPAYSFVEGYGSGANNWVIYLGGGGWCNTEEICIQRTSDHFGNSTMINQVMNVTGYSGILDRNQTFNPEFANWNMAVIFYCDGSSFMSDVEEVDPKKPLYFRGARIFDVMMEELLAKGMKNAQNAILSGGSAGALATFLNCDKFRTLLPNASRVKCLADAGFFVHAEDQPGAKNRSDLFAQVVKTHKLADKLPKSCTSKMNASLCLFPENFVGDIQTPVFILDSIFDRFQMHEQLLAYISKRLDWRPCGEGLKGCNSTQIEHMRGFSHSIIKALQNQPYSSSRAMFVDDCFIHGRITQRDGWMCSSVEGTNTVLANKSIGQAFGDWFFDRSSFQVIDTQHGSPRNCYNSFPPEIIDQKCLATLPHKGSNN